MHARLVTAAKAFDAGRFDEARVQLVPVVKEAPELAEGRELMGLVRYRLGQWKQAVEELEAFRELSGSTEQHPVLADCHRALEHWADVDALWAELGQASPSADLVTEGRIVTAGARADRGDTTGAIMLLEKGWKLPKHPRPHHLRRAYALADLYERAGRSPRARELFRWVADHAPDLADVKDRVRALS
jgi:tetratricopeptide (TPR) repeat protein